MAGVYPGEVGGHGLNSFAPSGGYVHVHRFVGLFCRGALWAPVRAVAVLSHAASRTSRFARAQTLQCMLPRHPTTALAYVRMSAELPQHMEVLRQMASYILRMFWGEKEVGASPVAIVPGADSYPSVGQTIDDKWRVVEVLPNSTSGEYHVRVEPLGGSPPTE
jgi:hypothetical protein